MRRAASILLILALVVFAFGIVRWVALTRDIAEEKREQSRSGRVVFNLSREEGWKTSDYIPRRSGLYSLVLESQGRDWKPHPTAAFAGSFELEVLDSSRKLVKRMRVNGASLYHTNESHIHWSGLDTVTIDSAGTGAWQLRVLTAEPDPNFKETTSAIVLQPPSDFDVGWAGFSGGIESALLVAVGFILLLGSAASWYFARRNTR
jgi:hypothetical protein